MNISVVMPVYNETNHELFKSINSVLNQTYSKFEFIIIDDNPNSLRIKKLLNKFSNRYHKIKILYNSRNIGPSLSTNRGIQLAHGNFIAKMDADDICARHRLYSQLVFCTTNNLDLSCSNFKGFNDNIINSDPYYGKYDVTSQKRIKRILSRFNIAMGPTLFFKRKPFLKIHGYRNILAEDYDLIARFIVNNYMVGYQSSSLIYKRNRRNNLSNKNALTEFMVDILISKSIRKNNYNNVISIKYIKKMLYNINKSDIESFNHFNINFNKFKNNKSIKFLLKSIINTFSSSLLLKRNFYMLLVKINNALI